MTLSAARKLVIVGLMASAAMAGSTQAAEPNGRQLHEACRAQGAAEQRACHTVLARLLERIGEGESFCLPNGYELEQIRQAFLAWAQDYPEELEGGLVEVTHKLLADEFPCSD